MASFVLAEFPQVGTGFTIRTQSIPLAGLVCVMRMARANSGSLFRYSLDGGLTYTGWFTVNDESLKACLDMKDTFEVVLDYVTEVKGVIPSGRITFSKDVLDMSSSGASVQNGISSIDDWEISIGSESTSTEPVVDEMDPVDSVVYDRTGFKNFFDVNDLEVVGWAWNVLEKMYIHGVVPIYISRTNADDFNSFFLAITHLFAIIVVYGRKYRRIEDSEVLMKTFLEQWGIVYETIFTQEERTNIFNDWIGEFSRRGTSQIADEGMPNKELRRLLGYSKPSEFLFAVLEPCNVGWCVGYSSPMWYGTESVNAVSKGWDYGLDWLRGNDMKGVGLAENYPIVGNLSRINTADGYVFQTGSGRCGLYSTNKSKAVEVYVGMDYEVTVWVKALSGGVQNIDFGVNCFDANGGVLRQVSLTDLRVSDSFFDRDSDHNPCLVPNVWYRFRGVIYNVLAERDLSLSLNFKDGKPLKFANGTAYLAPYIVQDGQSSVTMQIGGVTVKPLYLFPRHQTYNVSIGDSVPMLMDGYPVQEHSWKNGAGNDMVTTISPVGQGFLGSKDVVAIYSQIDSARTKKDIEFFIRNYLLSYKEVFWGAWLDYIRRSSYYLTFAVTKAINGVPLQGAAVTLSNGLSGVTDEEGYIRFEIETGVTVNWGVVMKGIREVGTVQMTNDKLVEVVLNLPVDVNVSIYQNGWGIVEIGGSLTPGSTMTLTAVAASGFTFKFWEVNYEEFTANPVSYPVTGFVDPIDVLAIFERSGEFVFIPHRVEIPYDGGTATVQAISSKKWALDAIDADWVGVSPKSGEAGTTEIRIEVGDAIYDKFTVKSEGSDDYEAFACETGASVADELFVKK